MMNDAQIRPSLRLEAIHDTPESAKDPMLRGETLPMWALRTGKFKIAQSLFAQSNPDTMQNSFRRTPLMYGALYAPEVGPNTVIMSQLRSQEQMSLSNRDKNGDSALFLAVQRGAVGITQGLIADGAQTMTRGGPLRNKRGQSGLDLAKLSKNPTLIALMQRATKSELERRQLQQELRTTPPNIFR